jgi:hypothetical protein
MKGPGWLLPGAIGVVTFKVNVTPHPPSTNSGFKVSSDGSTFHARRFTLDNPTAGIFTLT